MADEHEHPEQEEKRASPAAEVGSVGSAERAGKATEPEEKPRRHIWPSTKKWPKLPAGGWSRVFEAAVACSAVALLLVSGCMWWETRKSVDLTRRSVEATEEALALAKASAEDGRAQAAADRELTRRSVEATEAALALTEESNELTDKGAEIARESLRFSQEALAIAESPWVDVSMSKQPLAKIEEAGILIATLTNTGRSPAFNMRGDLTGHLFPEIPPSFPETSIKEGSSVAMLGAGMKHNVHTHVTALTDERKAAIKSGATDLYLFGEYVFTDRFGKNHRLRFCYWLEDIDEGFWAYCPAHNTYD